MPALSLSSGSDRASSSELSDLEFNDSDDYDDTKRRPSSPSKTAVKKKRAAPKKKTAGNGAAGGAGRAAGAAASSSKSKSKSTAAAAAAAAAAQPPKRKGTMPKPKPVMVLQDTTTADMDPKMKTNWEVAYVYAYLTKFTPLYSLTATDAPLQSITAFESALLESSPGPEELALLLADRHEWMQERDRIAEERAEVLRKNNEEFIRRMREQKAARNGDQDDDDSGDDDAADDAAAAAEASFRADLDDDVDDADDAERMDIDEALNSSVDRLPTTSTSGAIPSSVPSTLPAPSLPAVLSDANINEVASASAATLEAAAIAADAADHQPSTRAASPATISAPSDGVYRSPLIIAIIKQLQKLIDDEKSFKKRHWFTYLALWTETNLHSNLVAIEWQENWLAQRIMAGSTYNYDSKSKKKKYVPAEGELVEAEDLRWWRLGWQEKIHLLRNMVDYSLAYSVHSRRTLAEGYVTGKQRIIKRDPADNPLIIQPLGRVNGRHIMFVDGSSRLYSSATGLDIEPAEYDPYAPEDESNPSWMTLTTTLEEFEFYLSNLADPEYDPDRYMASIFKKGGAAADGRATPKASTSKSRGGVASPSKNKMVVDDSEEEDDAVSAAKKEEVDRLERLAQYKVRANLEKRLQEIHAGIAAEEARRVAKVQAEAQAVLDRAAAQVRDDARAAKALRDAQYALENGPRSTRSNAAAVAAFVGTTSSTSSVNGALAGEIDPDEKAVQEEEDTLTPKERRALAALENPGTRSSRAPRVSYALLEDGEDDDQYPDEFDGVEGSNAGSKSRGKGKGKGRSQKRPRSTNDDNLDRDDVDGDGGDDDEEAVEASDEAEYSDGSSNADDEDNRRLARLAARAAAGSRVIALDANGKNPRGRGPGKNNRGAGSRAIVREERERAAAAAAAAAGQSSAKSVKKASTSVAGSKAGSSRGRSVSASPVKQSSVPGSAVKKQKIDTANDLSTPLPPLFGDSSLPTTSISASTPSVVAVVVPLASAPSTTNGGDVAISLNGASGLNGVTTVQEMQEGPPATIASDINAVAGLSMDIMVGSEMDVQVEAAEPMMMAMKDTPLPPLPSIATPNDTVALALVAEGLSTTNDAAVVDSAMDAMDLV